MLTKKRACINAVVSVMICSSISLMNDEAASACTTVNNSLKDIEVNINKLMISPNPYPNEGASIENSNLSRGTVNNGLINYAYNYLGTPYVYGANGPNSFDCSGFTKYVFSSMSINIPRTSQEQYKNGTIINKENLHSGDLVFFNTDTTLGHVGIYIGNGEFIHASCSKGVTISSLNNEYYSSRYAGAVRY